MSFSKLGTWRGIFSLDLKMTEETAEGAAQRVNAKRLAAKERKTAQLDENPSGQRESKRIVTENDRVENETRHRVVCSLYW